MGGVLPEPPLPVQKVEKKKSPVWIGLIHVPCRDNGYINPILTAMGRHIDTVLARTLRAANKVSCEGTPNILKGYDLGKGFYFYALNAFLSKP